MPTTAKIRVGVIQFPGTNCEQDCLHVLRSVFGLQADLIWHADRITHPAAYQCLILPGGFSHGDYLRAGAMAMLSPVVEDVVAFAAKGGLLLGICNGFQVLTELKLLPGALLTNHSRNFVCRQSDLLLQNSRSPFLNKGEVGRVYRMPIAHHQGCYFIDETGLAELQQHDQILLRYASPEGKVDQAANPNGSVGNIAAISNKQGNVMGMMPHPERCCEQVLGGVDGRVVFESMVSALN